MTDYLKDAKKSGQYWALLTPRDRDVTVATLTDIRRAGQTVASVWADWQRWQKNNADTIIKPMPYEDAVNEWERRKTAAGKTSRYVTATKDVLLKFGEGRLRQPIHELSAPALETWFTRMTTENAWSLSTQRTYQLLFSSLWKVAVDKEWASVNIVEKLEEIKVPGPKVRIYDNETTVQILAAAMHSPVTQAIIAPLALGFFGCMRPEEIDSTKAKAEGMPETEFFQWSDIDLAHGLCKVRITKTGDERTIRLQPVAVAWLKLAKELKSPLPPVNERRLVDQCCELIGLKEWLRDGLRKNCATHLRAVYKNDYDVVKDCGNSVRGLLKWYAALHVPDDVSLDHWKISPDRVRAYMKTDAWQSLLRNVSDAAKARQAQLASGTGKHAG